LEFFTIMKELMKRNYIKKWFYVLAGLTSLGVGAVGVFVPLLPTTPFLLLAAACFLRSSDRLYQWLMNHRIFGSYIRNYREHRAMSITSKILVISLLWITIGYSILQVVQILVIQIILFMIAFGVTIHIITLKTPPPKNI
jgi:uncharacterized membrane protein YbaN (DUF454 family)